MSKIFIQSASYRDPQLLPTLKDCIDKAKNPENLVFCIAHQRNPEDEWDNLDEYKDDPRFKVIDINYKDAKGACWARNQIQQLYNGEEYTLQLDSHHRFTKNWDRTLKDYLAYLQCKGTKKPILSAYIPGYFPEKDPLERVDEVWGLNIMRFLPEGAVFLQPFHVPNWQTMTEPFRSRFVSGHFIFSQGKFVKEVPYDPSFYFHGEETSLSARAYTHGYDLFSPHKPIVWHEYTRQGKQRHWDDHKTYNDMDKASYARFRRLFEMEEAPCTPCQRKALAPFGFGQERSLEDYEKYAGLKFKTRQVHQETLNNQFPPIAGDYESGLVSKVKYCINVYKGSLTETDYDSIAIALVDENGEDQYRQDMNGEEFMGLIKSNPEDQFIQIWREYENSKMPSSWRVWPHSASKGWMERLEDKISYE